MVSRSFVGISRWRSQFEVEASGRGRTVSVRTHWRDDLGAS